MRIARGVASLALLFAPVAACGPPPSSSELPAGDSAHILTVDGRQRTYHLHVPASLGHRAALVVVLHGGKGTGLAAEQTMGWDAVADRVGAVVAYPDGVGRTWNAGGGCCGTSAATGIDDVTFISRLVHQLLGDTRISPDRVYATGGSNGGMLTYALACSTPIFAAIAPVAATQLGECRDPHPTSVLHIHGSADQLVRYDGRPVTPAPGYPIDGPPIPALMSRWRSIDECTAPTETHANGLRVSLASCVSGRVVELVVIDGGGHAWSKAFTPMIWDFFARHHR